MELSNTDSSGNKDVTEGINLEKRLRYLLIDESDAKILQEMKESFESISDEFIKEFYEHLEQFPEVSRFFKDPAMLARLKGMQKEHLLSMFNAHWDEEYVKQREKIGYSHSSRGVDSHFVLGGYYQYARLGLSGILSSVSDSQEKAELYSKVNAVLKVIFLDIGLTLDAYFKQSTVDLEKALDMLWRTNTELKQFAQLASHDLKTPLATVANICEEILDEYPSEMPGDSAELVSTARQTVLNMSAAINELLSATEKLSLAPEDILEKVDSKSAVENVLERLTTRASQRGININVSENLPVLIAHEVFLKEVLFNLISNAIKYIDKQPGNIVIRSEIHDVEGVLIVQDNGPGIPQENIAQIFSPFKRLNQHQAIPGSGLGLYYSRYLVEKQGGRIWVTSEEGNGSQFYIALPMSIH